MSEPRARGPEAVDEKFPNRHESAAGGGVESAVRAAGGVPTLGGGPRCRAGAAWEAGR
jgi:hypothetical protein